MSPFCMYYSRVSSHSLFHFFSLICLYVYVRVLPVPCTPQWSVTRCAQPHTRRHLRIYNVCAFYVAVLGVFDGVATVVTGPVFRALCV